MARKKAASKKKAARPKAPVRKPPARKLPLPEPPALKSQVAASYKKEAVRKGYDEEWKCNVPHICEFLQQLSDWLQNKFIPDYTALRIAVCNVEDQAFGGAGNPNKPPRFCTGGGTNEPAPPPPPPVW